MFDSIPLAGPWGVVAGGGGESQPIGELLQVELPGPEAVPVAAPAIGPAEQAAGPDIEVVASRISCRQQIDHLAGRRTKHRAEVLWELLRG